MQTKGEQLLKVLPIPVLHIAIPLATVNTCMEHDKQHTLPVRRLLAAHSNPTFPPWLAIGFNLSNVPLLELQNYTTQVQQHLQDLDKQRPWMVKDPRMIWLAPLWLQRMDAPVCVFMYRHPQEVAARLSTHWFKGHDRNGTFKAHLHAWAHGMHAALSACVGKPTIVLPHSLLKADTLMIFVRVLSLELERAGEDPLHPCLGHIKCSPKY